LVVSAGKQRGLRALSDDRGVFAAIAIDQRSALRKLAARLPKRSLPNCSTPYASAILLDPEFWPAAAKRDKKAGLLLAYEKTGYDKLVRGRLPRLLDDFSVMRRKEAGANAVKALLYYSPFREAAINRKKRVWVERVGSECIAGDPPFFLELVSYHDDIDEKSPEFARIKPELVTRSVEEFCKPRYAVDVLKVGVPVNMKFLESAQVPREQALYARAEAKSHFRRASDAATLPFINLSEGVSNEAFSDALAIAADAGSTFSGVLCGRAIWQNGVPVFVQRDAAALEDWLGEHGVRNVSDCECAAHCGASMVRQTLSNILRQRIVPPGPCFFVSAQIPRSTSDSRLGRWCRVRCFVPTGSRVFRVGRAHMSPWCCAPWAKRRVGSASVVAQPALSL
jgi:tagatose 1,6-diphosphate aldolase